MSTWWSTTSSGVPSGAGRYWSASGTTSGTIRTGVSKAIGSLCPSSKAATSRSAAVAAAALAREGTAGTPGWLRIKRKQSNWLAEIASTLPDPDPEPGARIRGETWWSRCPPWCRASGRASAAVATAGCNAPSAANAPPAATTCTTPGEGACCAHAPGQRAAVDARHQPHPLAADHCPCASPERGHRSQGAPRGASRGASRGAPRWHSCPDEPAHGTHKPGAQGRKAANAHPCPPMPAKTTA
jgi:hypothetical protein